MLLHEGLRQDEAADDEKEFHPTVEVHDVPGEGRVVDQDAGVGVDGRGVIAPNHLGVDVDEDHGEDCYEAVSINLGEPFSARRNSA